MTLTLPPASRLGRPGEVIAHGTADPPLGGIIQFADPITISGQLDMSEASGKAHDTASATARRTSAEHRELRDARGEWTKDAGAIMARTRPAQAKTLRRGDHVMGSSSPAGEQRPHEVMSARHVTRGGKNVTVLRLKDPDTGDVSERQVTSGSHVVLLPKGAEHGPAAPFPILAETQADRERLAGDIRQQTSVAAALAEHKIETARQLKQISDEHAAGMDEMLTAIKSSTEGLAASIEADEAKVARHRLAWHVALLAGGAVLAGVTLGVGAPIAAVAAAGLAPGVIQELIDFFKGM